MDNINPFKVIKKNPAYAVILMFGGDNNLNDYIERDMQEILAGIPNNISVLCMVDSINNPAVILELTKTAGVRMVERLGDVNIGDTEKLEEFIARAIVTYSRNVKIAIGFWSHGTGIYDEHGYQKKELIFHALKKRKSNPAIPSLYPISVPYSLLVGRKGRLTTKEAGGLLETALNRRVSMLFSDSCLNGMIEVMQELAKYAEVIVASTDLEPGDGWDYKRWFDKMATDQPTDSESWAKQAVAAFEESYKDKTDLYLHPCTLGAFRTNNSLAQAFKELIEAVDAYGRIGWYWMNDAREQTQSFSGYATYDLFHFTQNLLIVLEKYGVNVEKVKEKAQALADAFQKCRVHSVALGEKVRNSHGLGFWFPYEKAIFMKDVESYSGLSFDKDTGWTSYLKKYYLAE